MNKLRESIPALLTRILYEVAGPVSLYYHFYYLAKHADAISELSSNNHHIPLLIIIALALDRAYSIWFGWIPAPPDVSTAQLPPSIPADKNREDLLEYLLQHALSADQIRALRESHGYNELTGKPSYRDWLFWTTRNILRDSGLLLCLVASAAALYLDDALHALIPAASVSLNIGMTVWQIRQAEDVVAALSTSPHVNAIALRDNDIAEIPSRELIPGDIIHIREGDIFPADAAVMSSGHAIAVDQSHITGDNTHIQKTHGDTCFMGTRCVSGDTFLFVEATGYNTFIGRTINFVSNDPFRRRSSQRHPTKMFTFDLEYYRVFRSVGISVCAIAILTATIFNPDSLSQLFDLVTRLMLIVLPVSMHSRISVIRVASLALQAKYGAIFQDSSRFGGICAEYAAAIDVLCSDKTGTMTRNVLVVSDPFYVVGDEDEIMLTACLTTHSDEMDPIDTCLMQALRYFPLARARFSKYTSLGFRPFDASSKMVVALVQSPAGQQIMCVKGAPKAVFHLCHTTKEIEERYINAAKQFAKSGVRCLGIARKIEDQPWELLGLVPIRDPPRADLSASIHAACEYGIKVKMVTGDAAVIAQSLAVGHSMSANYVYAFEKTDPNDATKIMYQGDHILAADVYAEATAVDKSVIVRELQEFGLCVAMTGDGTSDAPSLRDASFGIAVEGSTETAQHASDLTMVTAGLSGIMCAIQRSRQTLQLTFLYVTYRALLSIQLLLMLIVQRLMFGDSISFAVVLINVLIGDVVARSLDHDSKSAPFPRAVKRWSVWRLWTRLLPMAVLITSQSIHMLITVSLEQNYHIVQSQLESAKRSPHTPVILLQTVLSVHPMLLVLRTDGHLFSFPPNWRLLGTILSAAVAVTLLCWVDLRFGMCVLKPEVISRIWISNICSLCFISGVYSVLPTTAESELILPILDGEAHNREGRDED